MSACAIYRIRITQVVAALLGAVAGRPEGESQIAQPNQVQGANHGTNIRWQVRICEHV